MSACNELIGEIQEERNKAQGTRNEQMQTEILNNIKQNPEKINHHGKRADAILKGMLQHLRCHGTGLGLSLSYDIVKAHGGEIKLKTKEREGSQSMIELPVK